MSYTRYLPPHLTPADLESLRRLEGEYGAD